MTSFLRKRTDEGARMRYTGHNSPSFERGWRHRGKPTPDGFKALFVTTNTPGFAPAAMNFRIEDAGPAACTLTTETRVYAIDASTRRRFAL